MQGSGTATRDQPPILGFCGLPELTVDDRNPASPYVHVHIYVLYYQDSYSTGYMRST